MAGEVTSANVMKLHAELTARLNNDVKAGKISTKEAQKQIIEFVKTNNDAIQEAHAQAGTTQADAAAEAKNNVQTALGFTRSGEKTIDGRTLPEVVVIGKKINNGKIFPAGQDLRADDKELAKLNEAERKEYDDLFNYTNSKSHGMDPAKDAKIAEWNKNHPTCQVKSQYDKPKMTKMQERLLKQAQQFYPEADVVLDDTGKVVVKDKKTGKIDEPKTKEAQSIKIDGSTAKVEIKADDADPNVKLRVPDKESVEDMQQYNTKEKAHSEFTTGSKEKADAAKAAKKDAKKAYKAKDKEVKQLEKEYDKAVGAQRGEIKAKLDKARKERSELLHQKEETQNEYTKQKALASSKGERGIARAARKNEKNYGNVDKLHHVFTSKAEEEAFLKEHPEEKDHTTTLSRKQRRTLENISDEANRFIKEAEDNLASATDEASKKKAQENLDKVKTLYGDLAECYDPNTDKVDAKKLQSGFMQFSGADARMNIDEKTQMAKQFNSSRAKIRSLAKEVGFGDESRTARKLGAAALAAATVGLSSLLTPGSKHATAEAEATAEAKIPPKKVDYVDYENGVLRKKSLLVPGKVVEASATALATAVAKIPTIASLGAPVIAGVTAFLLSNPQSKDAFNGNSVDHVLSHLDDVSGNDNKKIVAQIQDMTITGDPVRDKAIKAAVIQASLGTGAAKANTEELLAAYQSLKDTKEQIGKIDESPEPTVPTEPTHPTEPSPVPTPKPDPKVIGGKAVDQKLMQSHGIPKDQWDKNHPENKNKAQIVIADEDGEISVTGENMKEPDTITIKDNTNTKVNTFEYRKLTAEEIKNGKTKDGLKLKGLNGKSGPFYVLVSVKDDEGNLKNNNTEVYQLEPKIKESENGDEYYYDLVQYEGMNGSGKSSMQWPNRATRRKR